jgi:hypothetical protein
LKPSKAGKGSKGRSTRSGKAPAVEEDDKEDDEEDKIEPSPTTGAKRTLPEVPEAGPAKRRNSGVGQVQARPILGSPPTPTSQPDLDARAGAEAEDTSHDLGRDIFYGPNTQEQEDTYTCLLDGCTHKIYLASRHESQRSIREHFQVHAYDDDERVKMVERLRQPSLPVSHLMERVRLTASLGVFQAVRLGGVGIRKLSKYATEGSVKVSY